MITVYAHDLKSPGLASSDFPQTMLSSTRATARTLTARACSSFAQALPAESSRQGLLRAIAQQRQAAECEQRRAIHHRRRNGSTYSTAVAYADEDRTDRVEHVGVEHWPEPGLERERLRYRRPPPDRAEAMQDSRDKDDRLSHSGPATDVSDASTGATPSSLSALIDMSGTDPVRALHQLPLFPPETLSQLTSRQLTDLLKNLYKTSRDPGLAKRPLSGPSSERSLAVLRNLLYDLPSSPLSNDRGLGKRFHRDLLGRFLRACAVFDCDDLLRDTVMERLRAQRQSGELLVQPDLLATELAIRRRWDLIIDLFSPSRFPVSSLTPFTIQRLMQAHLGSGRSYKVPTIFGLYTQLKLIPPPRAYSLLVQANLLLGDIDSARAVMQESLARGAAEGAEQQLAILKGHRGLGRDEAMERRALELGAGLGAEQEIAIINAIIRLRLDTGDGIGAQSLLDRFRFDAKIASSHRSPDQQPGDLLSPIAQTFRLAFRLQAPTMSFEHLRDAWQDLVTRLNSVSDEDLVILFDTLARLGRLDTARALIDPSKTNSLETAFPLPQGFRVGALALNTLLSHACRSEGFAGLEKTMELFASAGVAPDERTLHDILDMVRTTTTSDPAKLANLLNALLRRFPNLKPSVDHVDLLLSQAVRARSRDALLAIRRKEPTRVNALDWPAEVESVNAQAGLRANDPFKAAMRGIIQSLQARGARSASRSLATRLRFDAHSGGSVPAVQTVWDDMLARGIRPDKRHLLALMKGYAESGHMRECEDVVLLARETGIEVTRGMWMVIMTGYGRRDTFNLARAERAFHTIGKSEQGLDPAAVCAMIGIYLRARRRHIASHLALQLVGNLVSTGQPARPSMRMSSWTIPPFPAEMIDERVIAIATDALRIDHPQCALEVITAKFPSSIPTRTRQVVNSIRSRSRSRIKWNVATMGDHEILTQAEEMLRVDAASTPTSFTSTSGGGRVRRIGPQGMKKRILRLFERRKHRDRGNGGRKVISAKEERRQRHEAISNAAQTLARDHPAI